MYQGILKPLFDFALSIIVAIVLSPVLLIIAVLIKLTDPGPVLYRGVRTGHQGTEFRIWKFRTMIVDAEKKGGGTTSLNDARITGIGGVLRKWKLDELPQVFNIMRGEMSFVGPRPELPHYTAMYNTEEKKILNVKPGVTDFSSVEFRSLDKVVGGGDADAVYLEKVFRQKNQLRLRYAREIGFITDVKLMIKTVAAVLKR